MPPVGAASGRDAGGRKPGLLPQDLHTVFGRWLGTPRRGEDAAPTHSPGTTLVSIQKAMSASSQLGSWLPSVALGPGVLPGRREPTIATVTRHSGWDAGRSGMRGFRLKRTYSFYSLACTLRSTWHFLTFRFRRHKPWP